MAMKLNKKAVEHAKNIIEAGKFESGDGDWSEHQLSTEEENKYLNDHGWEEYAKWFLAIDDEKDKSEKGRYSFPYGDFKSVHRGGLIAAKQRAAQHEHKDVEVAADELILLIDKMEK